MRTQGAGGGAGAVASSGVGGSRASSAAESGRRADSSSGGVGGSAASATSAAAGGTAGSQLDVPTTPVATIDACTSGNADVTPDFGANVKVIDPSMSAEQVNAAIAASMGSASRQVFFKPGIYGSAEGQDNPGSAKGTINATLNSGTVMSGLGASPTDVVINGALHIDAAGFGTLGTFARSLTNLSINAIQADLPAHTMSWATSQTCHWRRVDLNGNVTLVGVPAALGFGNMFANSRISGTLDVGEGLNTAAGAGGNANGMYYVRDGAIGEWKGFASQMVFSGVTGAPADNFGPGDDMRANPGDKVTLPATPISREAPFIYINNGHYNVFVPKARTDTSGTNWSLDSTTGTSMCLADFHIARPGATADELNEAVKQKNLLLTPGTYNLSAPLQVNRADAVVMGLGFAQVNATSRAGAVVVGDVPGVILSGFSVGGGPTTSEVLVRVGTQGAKSGVADNPTTLTDVHISGTTVTSEIINQDHVLVDGAWIRSDFSSPWAGEANSYGIVVNGDNVTFTGLWVEHYSKTQMTWNGNGGRVVFLEHEPPYEPPSQAMWMNGSKEGYPGLKVADSVTSFKLDGFGSYARYSNGCDCFVSSAIETPVHDNVLFHGLTAASINFPVGIGGATKGGFRHIINDFGPPVDAGLDSGNSRLPYSDVFGFTSNHRIANFPQ